MADQLTTNLPKFLQANKSSVSNSTSVLIWQGADPRGRQDLAVSVACHTLYIQKPTRELSGAQAPCLFDYSIMYLSSMWILQVLPPPS